MKIINDIMATRLLFFIMSFFVGLWTIRIPTIKDQINTDYFGIGLVMATFAIGSIIAMVFANNIIKMSSARTILLYTSIVQAILWLPTPFIPSLQIFMIFSFIFGLCYGSFEISCNLYASNLEKREKKSMMSGFHAFWSLGVLTGSIATSLFLEWNISFLNNVIAYVIILLPFNVFIVLRLHADSIENSDNKQSIFFIWPLLICLLALISGVNALTEGSVDSWGALYMRDFIKVDGFLIGLATVSFNICMVIGVGDGIGGSSSAVVRGLVKKSPDLVENSPDFFEHSPDFTGNSNTLTDFLNILTDILHMFDMFLYIFPSLLSINIGFKVYKISLPSRKLTAFLRKTTAFDGL